MKENSTNAPTNLAAEDLQLPNNEMHDHCDTLAYIAESRAARKAALNDLPMGIEQTEEVKGGGRTCQNNLKQLGLAAH